MIRDITFLLTDNDVVRLQNINLFLGIQTLGKTLRTACKAFDQCAKIAMSGEHLLVRNGMCSRRPLAFPKPHDDPDIYAPESDRPHAFTVKRMNFKRLEELRLYARLATRHELASLAIRFLDFVVRCHRSQRPMFRESGTRVDRIRFDFLK
jgi:hypothetical protein